jgi:drug/metabolite transporter (DMT)-like permease
MSAWILALPLLAAALHATWNALLKTAADRMITLGFFAFVNGVVGLVLLMLFDPPYSASWGFIALSMAVKYAYYVLIYFAYRVGDLSLVYPLARGSAPLLVAVGAAVFAGEYLSVPAQVGVLIACLGISSLAVGSLGKLQDDPLPIVLALGTGLMIAIYTICDGLGVRASGSVFGFLGWMYVLELPVVLAVVWLRRKDVVVAIGSHWRYGLLAGLCGVTGYSLVVYATLFVPLSIVSALRETSVIMAALIGTVLLGERPWQDRVAASSLVAGGVALMTVYR